MSEQKYRELHPGEIIQPGDEFCVSIGQDRWHLYPTRCDGSPVVASSLARRPIAKAAEQPQSQPIAYEEVPGSRTTQEAVYQPQRERIAYEELQPGDIIQEGDEWQNECGRWRRFLVLDGSRVQVRQSQRVRRPYNIATLQHERDELKTALCESRAAHEVTMKQGLAACKERDEACNERDLAHSEVARLSTELWARKPLEDRVASLTEELAQAREASQQLLQTITDNADQFADAGEMLEQQRDEARAELQRLQEVVNNLYSEPTARQVQQMLRTWATELDWSAGCFDSVGRDEVDTIQKTMVAVIERIEGMLNPEGGTDGE